MKTHFLTIAFGLLLSVSIIRAQADCPALVEQALNAVDEICQNTGRNQVCYANFQLDAEPQPDADSFAFDKVGDITNVADIAELKLSPMNTENNQWGVALMKLQANLPDTMPGQNVSFILFGDVQITNAAEGDELSPMQAFYLTTGVGEPGCEEAPENGLLIQTPEGVGTVNFVINEVEVQVGSTVFFQAQPDSDFTINVLEGAAVVRLADKLHTIIPGTRLRLRLGQNLRPLLSRRPILEAYTENLAQRLPLRVLSRRIQARLPLTSSELGLVRQRITENRPLCGGDLFPSCDHLPPVVGGTACMLLRSRDSILPLGQRLCDLREPSSDEDDSSTVPDISVPTIVPDVSVPPIGATVAAIPTVVLPPQIIPTIPPPVIPTIQIVPTITLEMIQTLIPNIPPILP